MGGYSSLRRCTRKLQLDYDTWYCIYQKLDSIIDQNSFGLSCVTFRDIQNSSRKSLKLRCSNDNSIIDTFIIDKLLNRHKQLEILTLGCHDCLHITYHCLTPLLKYGSTLHSLYLDRCKFITDSALTLVASACPMLSVISLAFTSVTDHGLKILSKSCTSLEEVNLRFCQNITDDGIYFLNQNCRQLRALGVNGCCNILGVGFRDCSPTLAFLKAVFCNLDSTGVSQIVSGGGLEYLDISDGLSYESRPSIMLEPIGLGFASKLKFLNIGRCSFVVDDHVVVKISRGCPLLQEWNLIFCRRIGITGWEAIGQSCHNLETLHVGYCEHLLEGLQYIGAGCKRLSLMYIDDRRKNRNEVRHFRSQRKDVEIKTDEIRYNARSWAFKTRQKLDM